MIQFSCVLWSLLLVLLGACRTAEPMAEPDEVASTLTGKDLEPVESGLTYHTPEYDLNLRQVLFAHAPMHSAMQLLIGESFEPEKLLSLYEVEGGFEASFVVPDRNVWYHKGPMAEIRVNKLTKRIAGPLAQRLEACWKRMLLRTRFQIPGPAVSLDGVKYTFARFEPGHGHWVAATSNPRSGSRPALLVAVGEALVAYVSAEAAEEAAALQRLSAQLDQLESALAAAK